MTTSPRVLTVGETMALLDPIEDDIAHEATYRLRIAGAESNFGIALRRLGVEVTWVSCLGADPFGDLVAETLAAETLDLRWVRRDPERQTGVFFKSRSEGRTRVFYYRAGSAASRLTPADVPDEALDGVGLVHLTGITAALGPGARALVLDLARRARVRGIVVVFDPNYRPALWDGPEQAADVVREVLPNVDWFLCGLEEGVTLFGPRSPAELVATVTEAGARAAAVRTGVRGAVVSDGSRILEVPPPRLVEVRDEVGAGDGFAAGFAYGVLHGWDASRCAHAGNVVAARVLTGTGDWETFPRLDEIRAELG